MSVGMVKSCNLPINPYYGPSKHMASGLVPYTRYMSQPNSGGTMFVMLRGPRLAMLSDGLYKYNTVLRPPSIHYAHYTIHIV